MSSLEDEILAAKSGPSVGVVVSLLIITVVISYFAYDSAPLVGLIAWCIAMIIMMVMRVTLQEKLSVDKNTPLQKRMRSAFVLTAATGVVHASSFLFFPEFTLTERTIQTIMMRTISDGQPGRAQSAKPGKFAFLQTCNGLLYTALEGHWVLLRLREKEYFFSTSGRVVGFSGSVHYFVWW